MPASRTYLGLGTDGVSSTTKTMPHTGAGVRTGRWVVTLAARQVTAGPADALTVTLNGVSLTKLVGQVAPAAMSTSIWISTTDITTDGTDTVVATFAAAQLRANSWLYAINGAKDAAFDTAGSTSGAPTSNPAVLSVDMPAGGVGFGVNCYPADSASYVWTGLTEDFESAVDQSYTVASGEFASASTPLSITSQASVVVENPAACSVSIEAAPGGSMLLMF